jgi:hypothetical protein
MPTPVELLLQKLAEAYLDQAREFVEHHKGEEWGRYPSVSQEHVEEIAIGFCKGDQDADRNVPEYIRRAVKDHSQPRQFRVGDLVRHTIDFAKVMSSPPDREFTYEQAMERRGVVVNTDGQPITGLVKVYWDDGDVALCGVQYLTYQDQYQPRRFIVYKEPYDRGFTSAGDMTLRKAKDLDTLIRDLEPEMTKELLPHMSPTDWLEQASGEGFDYYLIKELLPDGTLSEDLLQPSDEDESPPG